MSDDNLTLVGGAARSQPVSLVISKVTSAGGSVLHANHGQVAVLSALLLASPAQGSIVQAL